MRGILPIAPCPKNVSDDVIAKVAADSIRLAKQTKSSMLVTIRSHLNNSVAGVRIYPSLGILKR